MASITIFQGRRCTKVRRNNTTDVQLPPTSRLANSQIAASFDPNALSSVNDVPQGSNTLAAAAPVVSDPPPPGNQEPPPPPPPPPPSDTFQLPPQSVIASSQMRPPLPPDVTPPPQPAPPPQDQQPPPPPQNQPAPQPDPAQPPPQQQPQPQPQPQPDPQQQPPAQAPQAQNPQGQPQPQPQQPGQELPPAVAESAIAGGGVVPVIGTDGKPTPAAQMGSGSNRGNSNPAVGGTNAAGNGVGPNQRAGNAPDDPVDPFGNPAPAESTFETFVPIPIVQTSDGVVFTTTFSSATTVTGRASPIGSGGGAAGDQPTASDGSLPTIAGSPIIDGGDNSRGGKMNAGMVGGVIAGIIGVVLIAACLFFCTRARRNRRGGSGLSIDSRKREALWTARSVTPLSHHIRTLFARRKSDNPDHDTPRSTTPALERGMGRDYMTNAPDSNRSRRSLSAPPAGFAGIAGVTGAISNIFNKNRSREGFQSKPPPALPRTETEHRRSVSSYAGMAYPVFTDTNNPFRDPEPEAPLRIINSLSRQNTATTLPPILQPQTPAAAIIKSSPSKHRAAPSQDYIPPLNVGPGRLMHSRSATLTSNDPFADDLFSDPSTPLMTSAIGGIGGTRTSQGNHARSRTLATIESVGTAITTSNQGGSGGIIGGGIGTGHSSSALSSSAYSVSATASRHLQRASGDSGFASASPHSLQQPSTGRFLPLDFRTSAASSSSSMSSAGNESWRLSINFGEPGPTRPASFESNKRATMATTNRVSDPFDLDHPEVLGLMYAATTPSLSRAASVRSADGALFYPSLGVPGVPGAMPGASQTDIPPTPSPPQLDKYQDKLAEYQEKVERYQRREGRRAGEGG